MEEAAANALSFVEGYGKPDFLADLRTQQAVMLSFILLGEYASRALRVYPEFAAEHPDIPWVMIRGLRNQIAHSYSTIDLDAMWLTIEKSLPQLLSDLRAALAR